MKKERYAVLIPVPEDYVHDPELDVTDHTEWISKQTIARGTWELAQMNPDFRLGSVHLVVPDHIETIEMFDEETGEPYEVTVVRREWSFHLYPKTKED